MTKPLDEADRAKAGTLGHHAADAVPITTDGEPFRELRPIGSFLGEALVRAERRRTGAERPIHLPWPSVAAQLGGGLWPGMHVLVSGTGVGKTTLALQMALEAAEQGTPVAYVGLELDELQIALRLVGEKARVSWSKLYLGKGNLRDHGAAIDAAAALERLPIYLETGKPGGWPASELGELVESMRARHPEQVRDEATGELRDVPGSLPMLVVLDFLQIIGGEPGERRELRERIGAAAYMARDVARRFNCAVLLISSAARNHYGVLAGDIHDAGLRSETTSELRDGQMIQEERRFIAAPDLLIGLGKEAGEIEYAADSVNVAVRMPGKGPDGSKLVMLATPKLRAGAPSWTTLRFNGVRFAEAVDEAANTARKLEEAAKRQEARAKKGGGKNGRAKEEQPRDHSDAAEGY